MISVKDRDPNRVDDPFLIDKMAAELPGIFLWMLEGLKRLLANQYRFTLSERTRKNLEAVMADGNNLDQFMASDKYLRFAEDAAARSTHLFYAYSKWCMENLETPVSQKRFSQFLFKSAGKYNLTFSKHIGGEYLGYKGVCVRPDCARL